MPGQAGGQLDFHPQLTNFEPDFYLVRDNGQRKLHFMFFTMHDACFLVRIFSAQRPSTTVLAWHTVVPAVSRCDQSLRYVWLAVLLQVQA
jgi:hypothetical protein